MPSQEDIAPHIEELARALGGTVSEDTIRQQLERYLEHGVPVHQAKKDIMTSLSGGRTVRKKIKDITPSDASVDVLARVLSVETREVNARGERKTIWEGELADKTGRIAYTSWVELGLEPGQVVEISDAYVRTWQGNPQVNIGDSTEVETRADDLLPPADELAEAAAVSPPSSGGQERTVEELTPGMNNVIVQGRILSVSERTVQVKGEPKTLWEGELADTTGRVSYTAWHDFGLEPGHVVAIENGYVRSFRGVAGLNFGENSRLERLDDDALPPVEALEDKELVTTVDTERRPIKELRPDMNAVHVKGRILSVRERDVEVKGEPKTLWEGELADDSGRVSYTAWDDHDLAEGDVVRIQNAYVRAFRGLASLNFGENASVQKLDDDELPPIEELKRNKPYTLGELERAGGAIGVLVRAVVLEVRDGSGLIFRCPECRRVLQKGECRVHGRVEGVADLRIKAVVDDGTGAVTAFFNRSLTEEILGRDLEACQEAAREAMTREVITDELDDKLFLRRVVLRGNASHDDYGTTLLVDSLEFDDPEDTAERAEDLLEKVHVLSQEVSA